MVESPRGTYGCRTQTRASALGSWRPSCARGHVPRSPVQYRVKHRSPVIGGNVRGAAVPPPRVRASRRSELLDLDGGAGLLELALELVGLLALDALLDGLRGLVDERLGLLEAQAGGRADDLDDLDLLVAGAGQDDVDRGRDLLLGAAAV